jgi:hypothetical protein
VAEHWKVFAHVGLLINEPPARPGCPLFSHPTTEIQNLFGVNEWCTKTLLLIIVYSAKQETQALSYILFPCRVPYQGALAIPAIGTVPADAVLTLDFASLTFRTLPP